MIKQEFELRQFAVLIKKVPETQLVTPFVEKPGAEWCADVIRHLENAAFQDIANELTILDVVRASYGIKERTGLGAAIHLIVSESCNNFLQDRQNQIGLMPMKVTIVPQTTITKYGLPSSFVFLGYRVENYDDHLYTAFTLYGNQTAENVYAGVLHATDVEKYWTRLV